MRRYSLIPALLLVFLFAAFQKGEAVSTSTPDVTTAPVATKQPAATAAKAKMPKTHNVDHDGVKHAPGSEDAVQKCGSCHGKDLRGGKVAPSSCFECHEKNW